MKDKLTSAFTLATDLRVEWQFSKRKIFAVIKLDHMKISQGMKFSSHKQSGSNCVH